MGDMDIAHRMIEEATSAGADIVKFQSYWGSDVPDDDPEREWFTRVQVSNDQHKALKTHAEELGVQFLSSPFSIERARFLCEELGLQKIKIASSEMMNFPLLDYVNEHASTVFMSTGLSNLEEIDESLSHLKQVANCYVLHCCTQYPASDGQANLQAISTMRQAFPDKMIGYSDHTLGIDAAVASVALGAQVVEKHFTLGKTLPGTDHLISAAPSDLKDMVERIRRVEVLLGDGVKQPTAEELEIREFVRNRWHKRK